MAIQRGDTETKLLAKPEQVDDLIAQLQAAKAKAKDSGDAAYVRVVLQQFTFSGPWGLTIGVLSE